MKKKKILTTPVGSDAALLTDIKSGEASFEYKDSKSGVKFVYGKEKKWETDLERQTLKKLAEDKFLYNSGEEEFEFTEKHYYTKDGVKHYINHTQIKIKQSGKLVFEADGKEYAVTVEAVSKNGLKLFLDPENFIDIKEVETRTEELAQVEEQIKSLKDYNSELNDNIKEYARQGDEYALSLQAEIEKLSNDIEEKSINLENDSLTSDWSETDKLLNYKKSYNDYVYKDTSANLRSVKSYYNSYLEYADEIERYNLKENCTFNSISNIATAIDNNNLTTNINFAGQYNFNKLLRDAQEYYDDSLSAKQNNVNVTSLTIEKNNVEKQKALEELKDDILKDRDTLLTKNNELKDYLNNIEYTKSQAKHLIEKANEKIAENDIKLKQLEYRKIQLLRQLPEDYIMDSNGLVLGFNHADKNGISHLVVLANRDGENMQIVYGDNDRIETIHYSQNKKTGFEYDENNNLIKITSRDNSVTEFAYNISGQRIKCGDTSFSYDNSGKITKITSGKKSDAEIEYVGNNKIKNIREYSYIEKVVDDVCDYCDTPRELNRADFEYGVNSTCITDNKNQKIIYRFSGNTVAIETDGVLKNWEQEEDGYTLSVSPKKPVSNLLSGVILDCYRKEPNNSGSRAVYDDKNIVRTEIISHSYLGTESVLGDVILSSYIIPKSKMTIIGGENKTCNLYKLIDYSDSLPASLMLSCDYNINKAFNGGEFGLRTAVTYALPQDDSFIKECFVPLIKTDTQAHTAYAPLLLDYSRKPQYIEVMLDFNNCPAEVQVSGFTLSPQSYSYSEYDSLENAIYQSDGHQIITYSYDKDFRVIESKKSDTAGKTYTAETRYDKDGLVLYAKNFDGIITEYLYDEDGKVIKSVTYPQSNKAAKVTKNYTVTAEEKETQDESSLSESMPESIFADGFLTTVKSRGVDVNYAYDYAGRKTSVKISGENYCGFNYNDSGNTVTTTLADGQTFAAVSDKYNNVTQVLYNGNVLQSNTYDSYNRVKEVTDTLQNCTTRVTYDITEALKRKKNKIFQAAKKSK